LWSTAALAFNPISDSEGSGPGIPNPSALVRCLDDVYCSEFDDLFVADGCWNPATNVSGWITYDRLLVVTDGFCGVLGTIDLTAMTAADIPRGFAWDQDAASGDFWVSTWFAAGYDEPALHHFDAAGVEEFVCELSTGTWPQDPRNPGTGIQGAGLAMDFETGHLWVQTRNNPAGANTAYFVFDTRVAGCPVLLGGPWDAPYAGGPQARGAAGLEFYQPDCSLIAMHQDTNNVGEAQIYRFQTAGIAAPTYLGHCDLANIPCQGPGPSVGKPWGITVSEDPGFPPGYVIYSDINGDAACGAINPNDFHIVGLPPGQGQCGVTAVEPTTWGRIKDSYK
jgi:hypothetical protein